MTEYSKESEVISYAEAKPAISRAQSELRSMISMLDNETILNFSKLKSSIEFSE